MSYFFRIINDYDYNFELLCETITECWVKNGTQSCRCHLDE
ncbi:hypothetical protein [Spiroplasma endosymbiont of Polydrusus formosus]